MTSTSATFQVWLVFAHRAGGDELLGAFSSESKAAARVRTEARGRGQEVTVDEEGRPCILGMDSVHVRPLEVV